MRTVGDRLDVYAALDSVVQRGRNGSSGDIEFLADSV
jgi:hypothetical protein